MVTFEVETRITRKFGLVLRQVVNGAIYSKFRELSREVKRHNNNVITDINNYIYEFITQNKIDGPIKIKARIECDIDGKIKKFEITKIEVYKLEKEYEPNIKIEL